MNQIYQHSWLVERLSQTLQSIIHSSDNYSLGLWWLKSTFDELQKAYIDKAGEGNNSTAIKIKTQFKTTWEKTLSSNDNIAGNGRA